MSGGGLSKSRLARMRDVMAGYVERGEVPGLVLAVSRRGEAVIEPIGATDLDGTPIRSDTIFRISSLTKPITAAATMMCVEECTLRLDEPVDRLLPELADRVVLRHVDGPLTTRFRPAARSPCVTCSRSSGASAWSSRRPAATRSSGRWTNCNWARARQTRRCRRRRMSGSAASARCR